MPCLNTTVDRRFEKSIILQVLLASNAAFSSWHSTTASAWSASCGSRNRHSGQQGSRLAHGARGADKREASKQAEAAHAAVKTGGANM